MLNNIIDKRMYYTSNINYLYNGIIREYDISKANINIFYRAKVINEKEYNYYLNASKHIRQVAMGMLQKERKYTEILQRGIKYYRKKFIFENNINLEDILSIKNDAIFIINKIPSKNKFDNIEFVEKNKYTSFYKLLNLELYYLYDTMTTEEKIDIKGIKDSKLKYHKEYFLDFLMAIFMSIQNGNTKETIDIFNGFYEEYISKNLDIEYYRTFDSESSFMYNIRTFDSYIYRSSILDPSVPKELVNINTNLQILRQLYSYITHINLYK